MLFAQQASWAQSMEQPDCLTAVDRTYKTKMEMLMNQNYLGNIGGSEFEGKRLELLRFSETESEACLQNAVAAENEELYAPIENLLQETTRAPASIPSEDESIYQELINE